MTLKAIPRSRAKTAWGLLQDVKRAILAEPKRAHMRTFQHTVAPHLGGPACGTVGCFAGWTLMLAKGRDYRKSRLFRSGDCSSANAAVRLLGETLRYNLVGPEHVFVFNDGYGDACGTTEPGTRAHARAVLHRITKFMRINAKALKARKLAGAR